MCERERWGKIHVQRKKGVCESVSVCEGVCVRERERERGGEKYTFKERGVRFTNYPLPLLEKRNKQTGRKIEE